MRVVPYVSVGNLTFDDSKDVVREKLASPYTAFQKDVGESETDAFDGIGLHVYYDPRGKLEFVEAFSPADVDFAGIHLMARSATDVVNEIELLGYAPTETDVGFQFDDIGISLTVADGLVDGVGVFRKGYFDEF